MMEKVTDLLLATTLVLFMVFVFLVSIAIGYTAFSSDEPITCECPHSETTPKATHAPVIEDVVEPTPVVDDTPAMDYRALLDALRAVETGGEPNGGVGAIGDNGNARGPYQIWRIYWMDAVEHDRILASREYMDVLTDIEYSERVILAYWDRWSRGNNSYEYLARLHNGGPRGPYRDATLPYWSKVKAELHKRGIDP
jgi:hypothetical protein